MTLNHANLNRLIAELERMKADTPERFDYHQGYSLEEPGCVDCVCRRLMGKTTDDWMETGGNIAVFLAVSPIVAKELWVPGLFKHPVFGSTPRLGTRMVGEIGLTEALRRLYILRESNPHDGAEDFIARLRAEYAAPEQAVTR